jgi:hypothetical protein
VPNSILSPAAANVSIDLNFIIGSLPEVIEIVFHPVFMIFAKYVRVFYALKIIKYEK